MASGFEFRLDRWTPATIPQARPGGWPVEVVKPYAATVPLTEQFLTVPVDARTGRPVCPRHSGRAGGGRSDIAMSLSGDVASLTHPLASSARFDLIL